MCGVGERAKSRLSTCREIHPHKLLSKISGQVLTPGPGDESVWLEIAYRRIATPVRESDSRTRRGNEAAREHSCNEALCNQRATSPQEVSPKVNSLCVKKLRDLGSCAVLAMEFRDCSPALTCGRNEDENRLGPKSGLLCGLRVSVFAMFR